MIIIIIYVLLISHYLSRVYENNSLIEMDTIIIIY